MIYSSPRLFTSSSSDDPFGTTLEGRNWNVGSEYRYGFNKQEQDDEVYGNGNLNTAEFWEYDTRLGRRWNVDPVMKYDQSGYNAFANNPIWIIDINGADSTVYFYAQNIGADKTSWAMTRNIMKGTEEIFEKNGVTELRFKQITKEKAQGLKLDPSDAIIAIFPSGYEGYTMGSTEPTLNADGTSQDYFKNIENPNGGWNYLGNYITLYALEGENRNMGSPISNEELYSWGAAHEILHQYNQKFSLMFYGNYQNQPCNIDIEGHSTTVYPNLNMSGQTVLTRSNFITVEGSVLFPAAKMLAGQQAGLEIYLKAIKMGISATGSDANTSKSKELIELWNFNRLLNYPTDGIYAKERKN